MKYPHGGFLSKPLVVVAVILWRLRLVFEGGFFIDFGMSICKGYNLEWLVFEDRFWSMKYGICASVCMRRCFWVAMIECHIMKTVQFMNIHTHTHTYLLCVGMVETVWKVRSILWDELNP